MRILWLTNRPLDPVNRKFNIPENVMGGWMDSLRIALQNSPDIHLGIASASNINFHWFQEQGVDYYNIPMPKQHGSIKAVYRRWLHTSDFPDAIPNCLKIIEEFKPDLIHLHGSESFYSDLTESKLSVPVVISIQGILAVWELFYFGGYSISDKLRDILTPNFLRGISVVHNYININKAARRERKNIQNCKYFIGRTDFDKNFIQIHNYKTQSNYYHCDEVLRSQFYKVNWIPKPNNTQIIYCLSSAFPYKGLDCLLMACHVLKNVGFNHFQLRISGDILNSSVGDALVRKVYKLNLKQEIVWLGQSSVETILDELTNANLFVIPSYIENSPNSLAEAMLVGVPCVAPYCGGVPSMVTHGKESLLFQPGDHFSLAGMMARILDDPTLAQQLSHQAKALALERHNPQNISIKMEHIYSQIIAHHSKLKI